MKRTLYSFLILVFFSSALEAQEDQRRLLQVSGIITDASDQPVPGASIISKKLKRATLSEWSGIYSITSTPGDTIFFRALGFKRYHTVIPVDYAEKHVKVDIILEPDTIEIEPVTILPWKSYHEFIADMTKERPVDPIIENMNENLASIYVAIANQSQLYISPEAGYRYAMEQNFVANATKNQFPVNNLMNPFAWAKFVQGLKHGMLKNKKSPPKPTMSKVRKKKNSKK